MNNMRRGFTMIELIFVIVIIGILAAVAIPKLAATRDDAVISGEIASIRQAIDNLGAEYTATAEILASSITTANAATKCFTVAAGGSTTDGNVTITPAVNGTACTAAILAEVDALAVKNGILDTTGTAKTYEFGGSRVVR